MYNEKVMNAFQCPQNMGELSDANGVGQVGNPKCGDVMKVYIKVENNILVDVSFETFGCVAALASSDYLCEIAKGKTLEDAEKITSEDVLKVMGDVPQVKVHCSVLAQEALKKAIKEYKNKIFRI